MKVLIIFVTLFLKVNGRSVKNYRDYYSTTDLLNILKSGAETGGVNKNVKAFEINNVSKKDLEAQINKYLQDEDVEKYVLNERGLNKIINDKHIDHTRSGKQRKLKKVLVKRLVPRGQEMSPNYIYDSKFKTFYRPLVKIHNRNIQPMFFKSNKLPDFREIPNNYIEQRGDFEIVNRLPKKTYFDYDDNYLLQPFKVKPKRREVTAVDILKDIQNYIVDKDDNELRKIKYAILTLLENRPRSKTQIRSRPDKVYLPQNQIETALRPHPQKYWLPGFPFWNYWTYEKNVYQDDCKGQLVQLGNLCIETPPH